MKKSKLIKCLLLSMLLIFSNVPFEARPGSAGADTPGFSQAAGLNDVGIPLTDRNVSGAALTVMGIPIAQSIVYNGNYTLSVKDRVSGAFFEQ